MSDFVPGIQGFTYADLHDPVGLRRLGETFYAGVAKDDPELWAAFDAYRKAPDALEGAKASDLLIRMSRHLSAFVVRLFGIDQETDRLSRKLLGELRLFEFKREFITRRVFKKGAQDRPGADEFPSLHARMRLLFRLAFPEHAASLDLDEERATAESVLTLMEVERCLAGQLPKTPAWEARIPALRERWQAIREALLSTPEGKDAFGSTLLSHGDDAAELQAVRGLLSLADRWTFARALHPDGQRQLRDWVTHHQPKALHFDALVHLHQPDPERPEALEGPPHHLRRRDGFKLTDDRGTTRQVMNEVEYCVICHERGKDSCSRGFPAKDPAAEGHSFKKNPLGIPLTGCPLDEKISEAHSLKAKGDGIAALAMVMIDNPMCPGTGHRICNDCMKACIFQKQEPVNIPLAETHTLTDVLELPWGFEIYGLFTRWNPLNVRRPWALPYNGKNVLVVGLGPAGYTLSQYLLNEGFAVAGMDGLKVEPFPDELTGRNGHPLRPIRDFRELTTGLDQRVLSGFGGVSEYGITVRWDKNFLTLIHLTLARRHNLRIYGGIRFGGTLTIEDAWELGFDHLAIAAGAGRPTIIGMKNNLIRGIRKASDFLMALQLTGAFKKDSLANLQVQLPAVVIGGGLTGIDTATELVAFYPVQVEKILERHEKLCAALGEFEVFARLDEEEQAVYRTFLEHGRAVRAERERARAAGELPDLVRLVRAWGGVSLCYRRSLVDSPAYRLNHEEVTKALEEGIRFVERVSPVEALQDEKGAVSAVKFERMTTLDGRLKGTGDFYTLPAKTVCVAAGTSPNVTYEKEYPGTFVLDHNGEYFQGHRAVPDPETGGFRLEPVQARGDLAAEVGFFTSYAKDGRHITFYGDNHPTYAGNVVKAMASARDGYPEVVRLFEKAIRPLERDDAGQPARDEALKRFFAGLDDAFLAQVVAVNRLTPTIVEVVVKAKYATLHFHPGQFYRLQNFERRAPVVEDTRLVMEGLALTGAWVDKEKGLMSTIVLEMGSSSRMCAMLAPGEPVVLMGPTGAPTEIPKGETVLLAGGGLGNAVLFSIARALRAANCRVIYFAGYRKKDDVFKQDDIEEGTDQIIWSVDVGQTIAPRRPQDGAFQGNIVQAMVAFAEGKLVPPVAPISEVDRIIAIGSDRMMAAVKTARYGALKPFLKHGHEAIGSINSPMQCMMKEICAQCLQKHVDPVTGKETVVFSCFNQDQRLDTVDFAHLNTRLRTNSVVEKQSNLWLEHLLTVRPELRRI